MQSDQMELLIETIFQAHYVKFGKDDPEQMLKIYGVSQAALKEYVTSDKDILRRIDRRPNEDFLLDITGTG